MNGVSRAPATLLAAAIAGVLLWSAAQIGRGSTGGYWGAYALVAAAGIVLALSQLRGTGGHPPGMFLLGFLPVLAVTGWVLAAMQPHGNTVRSHVLTWSSDIHVHGAVLTVGTWLGVLAFGLGYVLGATLEPMRAARRAPVAAPVPAYDRRAASEPTTAERREVGEAPTRVGTREAAPR